MPDYQKQISDLGFMPVLSLGTAPAHLSKEHSVNRIREHPCFCSNMSNLLAAVVLLSLASVVKTNFFFLRISTGTEVRALLMWLADPVSHTEWLYYKRSWTWTARGKGEGTKGEKMMIATLGDKSGACENAASTCSARHLKLNEFFDLIEHGPEKSITTT